MKKIKVAPFLPTEVEVKEISQNNAQIIAYPFENGYAVTLAHPLRRLILGSSIGYAPISLKIDGAAHEFDSIRGMHEDVAMFIIHLKSIRFQIKNDLDRISVNYTFKGPREVTAADLINDQTGMVEWVDVEKEKLFGLFTRIPEREEVSIPVEERLIVELYSK